MCAKLGQLSALAQKDKGVAYLSLLSEVFSDPTPSSIAPSIHALVEHVITTDPGIIVGRQFFTELVTKLTDGSIADTEVRKTIIQDVLNILQPWVARCPSYYALLIAIFEQHLAVLAIHVAVYKFPPDTIFRVPQIAK
ncbi:hypothetical protein PENSPDRAFT_684331 [Peniophora sp. CONT]|nr:hypothetical protein PENSPDRAFT_684331 [Peniophora sp. CONT]